MTRKELLRRLPGYIATVVMGLVTGFWTYFGMAEMYVEGWGLPFPVPLRYLGFGLLFLIFTLTAPRLPCRPLVAGGERALLTSYLTVCLR